MAKIIHAIDSMLREGAQAPGVAFSEAQFAEIVSNLNVLGVDVRNRAQ